MSDKLIALLVSIMTPLSAMFGGVIVWKRNKGKDEVNVIHAWNETYNELMSKFSEQQTKIFDLSNRLDAEESRCDVLERSLNKALARIAALEATPPTA